MKHVHLRERQLALKFENTASLPYEVRRKLPNEQRRKVLPTRDELLELFDLEWSTGRLINRKTRGRAKKGTEAGCLDGHGRQSPYRRVRISGESYYAHHLVYVIAHGELPVGFEIDHINGVRNDNRPENLRTATHGENMRNVRPGKRNKSGAIGVCYDGQSKRWAAYIYIERKKKHLGYFDSLDEARAAREQANREHGYHENHGKAA